MSFEETYAWETIATHIFLSLNLLVFFPGQKLWTYRLTDSTGRVHTIIGEENAPHDEY